jgi:TonB family protein
MHGNGVFASSIADQSGTFSRLIKELVEAGTEFRTNPGEYLRTLFSPDSTGLKARRDLLRLGFALSLTMYSILVGCVVLLSPGKSRRVVDIVERPFVLWNPVMTARTTDLPDRREAHGGGGGGNGIETPASAGQRPSYSLDPGIVAPTPEPAARRPDLPFPETVLVDPRFQPPQDDLSLTGLPEGVVGPPSSGPGSDRGMGGGEGGGLGDGHGPGVGPGRDGNTGGGGYSIGLNGTPRPAQLPVDTKPVLLNNPRPFYTEEARLKKIQGIVRARLLVGADGRVKEVVVISGLAEGLTEQAIRAAYQMRFSPAMRSGHAVSYWLNNVIIEFNLR